MYCQNGAALGQRRNPKENQAYYFDRSEEEYEHGFGYTAKNYWMGLEAIQQLNANGNNILRIEGTIQNKERFWVEFYIVIGTRNLTMSETYPLLSTIQLKSSNGLAYTFARPYIQEPPRPPGIDDARYDIDRNFVSKEDAKNRTCPIRKHSSWWYPLQRDILGRTHCELNIDLDTNLNGVYHMNSSMNEFRIFACNASEEDDLKRRNEHLDRKNVNNDGWRFNCLVRDGYGYYYKNEGGNTLPLEEVQMFLLSSNKTGIDSFN